MRKVSTILSIGITVVLIATVWHYSPVIGKITGCFEQNVQTFDQAEYNLRGYGWAQDRVCQMKQDSIYNLEQCVTDAENAFNLPQQVRVYIMQFLPTIRPDVKNIEFLKSLHDQECFQYPRYMFNPPN